MSSTGQTHPIVIIAAIAVTAVSLVGIASITGLIPGSHQATPVLATPAEAPPPAVALPPPASPPAADGKDSKNTIINVPPGSSVSVTPAKPVVHHKPAAVARRDPLPPPPANAGVPPAPSYAPPPVCADCGVVENIREISKKGQGSGLGAVAGGLLGGILGHQVGGGRGQDVATVAGAIGGVFAGNEIEKSSKASQQYQIVVRLNDGSSRLIDQNTVPSWRIGDHVRVVNGSLVAD